MIRLLVLDVDGTMTDGGVYYDATGNELKEICHQGRRRAGAGAHGGHPRDDLHRARVRGSAPPRRRFENHRHLPECWQKSRVPAGFHG